jgi:signal transduction histidine kinase
LCIIFLFLSVVLIALSAAHSANQNQLWISLSKETAHQLGTPISSLEAWTVLLEQHNTPPELLQELQKDVHRLQLVADRFSKIGSTPKLEVQDLSQLVARIKDYMQVRAPKHVRIDCIANETPISIPMSATLIEWVIENLLRNALDAMTHKGVILISLQKEDKQVVIDISDTGKGMSKAQAKQIFKPGYSTKKRGWGLGLSLSKRIVEQYHKGSLQLRQTELGKGATFRIILPL